MPPGVADNKWNVETTSWPAVWWPRLGDERLARLAARGSQRAFAAVYERYHQVLYRYCRSILRDDADAQDALQSTFTAALSALKRGQRSAPLRPWLFRIAHNEAISVLRRRRRGEERLADVALPVAASAEDQAGERARMAMLLGDLAALPDRTRSALVMRELSGLSHEEIAIALDTTTGAAKQAIFEARRGLLECAEGRAMPCAEVCRAISDGDGRILRGRRVRAHLRDCALCATFAASIQARRSDLRALTPVLPAAASAAVLSRAVQTAVGHGGGGGAAAGGAGSAGAAGAVGKTMGVAFTSKGFATASVLATAAVSVGGMAAVVRLAPDSGRLFKAHTGHAAIVRTVSHARAAGHAGSSASTASRASTASSASTASRAGGSGGSGSSSGSVRSGTHAGAAGRHVRFAAWHGQGRAVGRQWATRGERGGWQGSDGGDVHRGSSVAGHGAGAMPGLRHGTLEGYAGGRAHNAGSDDHGDFVGHRAFAGSGGGDGNSGGGVDGHGGGVEGHGASAGHGSARADHADSGSGYAPGGGHNALTK